MACNHPSVEINEWVSFFMPHKIMDMISPCPNVRKYLRVEGYANIRGFIDENAWEKIPSWTLVYASYVQYLGQIFQPCLPLMTRSIHTERIVRQQSHYIDVIMTTMASQITSLAVVYSTVYSDADQRKHQIPASLAFVCGIHRDRWIPRTKGQLRGKCFHLMTSSCIKHQANHNLRYIVSLKIGIRFKNALAILCKF